MTELGRAENTFGTALLACTYNVERLPMERGIRSTVYPQSGLFKLELSYINILPYQNLYKTLLQFVFLGKRVNSDESFSPNGDPIYTKLISENDALWIIHIMHPLLLLIIFFKTIYEISIVYSRYNTSILRALIYNFSNPASPPVNVYEYIVF